MSMRLSSKYRELARRNFSDEELITFKKFYRKRRIIGSLVIVCTALVGSAYTVKDYADNRFSPISATQALNKNDELQEERDVIYSDGKVFDSGSSYSQYSLNDTGENSIMKENVNPSKQTKVTSSENILLVGMDTREGENGLLGAGSAADVSGTRTDTIMFLHIPKDGTQQPTIISFPRDLDVNRQNCAAWNGEGYEPSQTVGEKENVKINSLYGAGGPRCLVRTVQELTGMKVNRFAAVDFAGFQSIVDSIGGVDIFVDAPMIDDELGVIADKSGMTHFNGDNALNYVRARKVEGQQKSDYERIDRQQKFGTALLNKIASGDTLANPARINSLSDSIYKSIGGENIDLNFIVDILSKAKGFSETGINSLTYPTYGTSENGNELRDETAASSMMKDVATQ